MWYIKKYPHKIIFYLNHKKVVVVPFGREPLWGFLLDNTFYKSSELLTIFSYVLTCYTRTRDRNKVNKYIKVISDYFWEGEI